MRGGVSEFMVQLGRQFLADSILRSMYFYTVKTNFPSGQRLLLAGIV